MRVGFNEDRSRNCGLKASEKLHIEPPKIFVETTVRPKYACRCCEGTEDEDKPTVRIAPVEPSIIPRSIVSASLLSTIITQKFEDHLPYYRQETQFARIGVQISRQNMSNWQQQGYDKVKPVITLMKETLRRGHVIQMDETTVQVIGEEEREDTQKSRMWLARGGPPDKKVILYEYQETRKADHAKEILKGYTRYLQTDGYSGYDCAVKGNEGIIHAGCFAHARRKFFEAAKVSKQPTAAAEGIRYIKRLYVIEAELRREYAENETETEDIKARKREGFQTQRKALAEPVLDEFKKWLTQLVVKSLQVHS